MTKQCTDAVFLSDVSQHKMTVLLDNGVHRCVRFARTDRDSWYMHFVVTTWPDYLCINGDMGCFVFTRVEDMFTFFRANPSSEDLRINPQYWAEKCEAADVRTGGLDAYDEEKFKARVMDRFNEHEFEDEEAKARCSQDIQDQVFIAENEYEAFRYSSEFKSEGFELTDFWEHRLRSYSYQFVWCLFAIVWAIKQYDLLTAPPEVKA